MKGRVIIPFFLIALFAIGCLSKRISPKSSISYQRTACYGTCPIYSLTIDGSGLVSYNGERFADKLGDWQLQLDKSETQEIFNRILNIGWDTMSSVYDRGVTDFPSTILRVNHKQLKDSVVLTGVHLPALDSTFVRLNRMVSGNSGRWKQLSAPIEIQP